MAGDDETRASLARALRAHLEWQGGDLLGLPELDPRGLRASEEALAQPSIEGARPIPGPSNAPEAPSTRAAAPTRSSETPLEAATASDASARLEVLREQVRTCTKCELHQARKQTVFARGNPGADLVFVGEGPGRDEDQQGLPFVGAAGKLLDKMIAAMGRAEDDVYICNVVKCRPPQNRTPLPQEAGACAGYLEGQIDAVAPRIIVALGRCAAENLGCVPPSGGRWRGRWGSYRDVPVMPTYHPAFLLRSPEFKRPVWEDLQQVMKKLGR